MNKKSLMWVSAALLLVLIVSLWWVQKRRDNSQEGAIRIGAILPLTGPGAPFGESSRNALLLGQDEINGNPGGPKLSVQIEDGMTDPKTSVTVFNRLYDLQGVRLFITTVSGVSLALTPLADQKKALLFANASHPQITEGHQYVLRYSNTAGEESRVLLDFVSQQNPGWSNLYVIALNDDYGQAYVQEIKNLTSSYKGISIMGEEMYGRATTDFRAIGTKAIGKKPDAIVLIGFGSSMGLCIRQLRELGYSRPFIASLGFILSNDAISSAGEAARGGHFLNFAFVTEPGARAFRDKYRSRFGSDPAPNAVIDYGTINLLADAIRAVGSDPQDLVSHFRGMGKARLPTGEVTVSPKGDISAPVRVMSVPASGPISLWGN